MDGTVYDSGISTVLCRLFTPVQTFLIVLALMSNRQESEKSIKMVWQPFLGGIIINIVTDVVQEMDSK